MLTNKLIILFFMLCLFIPTANAVQQLQYVESADGTRYKEVRELLVNTHSRFVFNQAIKRVAVGNESLIKVEIINESEVLMLAHRVGKTSVIFWFDATESLTLQLTVTEDLSLLREALRKIDPRIQLTRAPDRDALVLKGTVASVDEKNSAELLAHYYLNAGRVPFRTDSSDTSLTPNRSSPALTDRLSQLGLLRSSTDAAVINFLMLERHTLTLAEKIQTNLTRLGFSEVEVERIFIGDTPDDKLDRILLRGKVTNQVELMRVLAITTQMLQSNVGGASAPELSMEVEILSNESGAAITRGRALQSSSGSVAKIENEIESNIARAKLLSTANGRVLSMIHVTDLPQINVSVQIYEVNRRALEQWRPDLSILSKDYNSNAGLFGLTGFSTMVGSQLSIDAAFQALGGALTSNLQIGNDDFALDLLFTLMEQQGISKIVSRPNLTVLAGETAAFRAGGEVPIQSTFTPVTGGNSDNGSGFLNGVFNSTEFKSFGVELKIRALVDENNLITLDLEPSVSAPNTDLTQQIAGATGASLSSSAFNVRSLKTTTRLRDGQPLIIGGLVNHESAGATRQTPLVSSLPIAGDGFRADSYSNEYTDLIIVVTPQLLSDAPSYHSDWPMPDVNQLFVNLPSSGEN